MTKHAPADTPAAARAIAARLRGHVGTLNHRVTTDRAAMRAAAAAIEKMAAELARLRIKTSEQRDVIAAQRRQLAQARGEIERLLRIAS